MDEPTERVTVALHFAAALWPSDPVPSNEATAAAWAKPLQGFSVDQTCAAFEELAKYHERMPALADVLAEIRDHARKRTRADAPLLDPPSDTRSPNDRITGPDTSYRARLRADAIKFARAPDGSLNPVKLAEIDAWVAEVGPIEAEFLRKYHGMVTPVTQPVRAAGGLAGALSGAVGAMTPADAVPGGSASPSGPSDDVAAPPSEPPAPDPPAMLDEDAPDHDEPEDVATTAAEWFTAWQGAAGNAVLREVLRRESAEFTEPLRQAVRALAQAAREQQAATP